jgi:hypothetical protein
MRRIEGSIHLLCWLAIACVKQPSDGPADMVSPTDSKARLGDAAKGSNQPENLGRIVVHAGALDRTHSIVRFPLAKDFAFALRLRDGKGHELPLQRHGDGTATFILRALPAEQQAVFSIERDDTPTRAGPGVVDGEKNLTLSTNDRTVVRFQKQGEVPPGIDEVYRRGGYLHPLFTPGGAELTGDYPVSHRHQHGIFSAWTRARFNDRAIDFWNVDDKQGKVDFQALDQTFQGPVFAGFDARLAHIDLLGPAPVVALTERWTVTTYQTHDGAPPYFVVDLHSTQDAATPSPLLLEQYTYGGFALRGSEEWSEPANVTITTSEGLDRVQGDGQKGRWCSIGGKINGTLAGFAMLGHPENFRAPQAFRIHPQHPYMAFAPIKDGPFTIEPGAPYVSRFRIVSFDGPLDRDLVDRLWQDYALPPKVTVEVL